MEGSDFAMEAGVPLDHQTFFLSVQAQARSEPHHNASQGGRYRRDPFRDLRRRHPRHSTGNSGPQQGSEVPGLLRDGGLLPPFACR